MLLSRAVGAYFGEVIRRSFAAFWMLPADDAYDWRIGFSRAYLALNPIGAAYDALTAKSEHDGPSSELSLLREEQESVAARLAALPEVAEEDYYRLSTRFEVIEIAFAALRSEMERAGVEATVYEAEDYQEPVGQA
jgi:hypothetical protein